MAVLAFACVVTSTVSISNPFEVLSLKKMLGRSFAPGPVSDSYILHGPIQECHTVKVGICSGKINLLKKLVNFERA